MSTGTRLGKQVIVGETNKTVEERPDVEDRIIQFSYVVGLNGLTKEQVDQFGEELSKEIAEHLIGDEKEKVMLLDWKDIRDLSAVEGYKLAALFKKAKEELEASSG